MATKAIKTGRQYRFFEITRDAINQDARTMELSFSSELAYERWWGVEILDHGPGSIRMDRIRQAAPLLVGHDTEDQVGVIEEASISGDRKGRALVRFGKSARAEEIFQDVLDGIRRNVSVGYRIHEMVLESEKEGVGTYRATDWEPFEISLVPVPADVTVGVGRSEPGDDETRIIRRDQPMAEEKKVDAGTAVLPAAEAETIRGQERDAERARVQAIMKIGKRHQAPELADKYINEGKSVDDFRAAVLEGMPDPKPILTADQAITAESRAVDKPWKSMGEQLRAVIIAGSPGGRTDPRLLARAGTASGASEAVDSDGGFLVQMDFSTELLKRTYDIGAISSRVRRVGIGATAKGLTMNAIDETSRANGSRWGGIQAFWADEADTVIAKKPKLRRVNLILHKLMGLCYATEELLEDAAALQAIVTQGFSEEFNFTVEDAILNGTGAGQPVGILNSNSLISVAKETGQLAKTVVVENIVNMWSRCYGRSRPNAIWFYNQDIEPQLMTMGIIVGTGGAPIYMPAGGLSASPFGTLLGRPMIPVEYAATLGTLGDLLLLDLSQYLMIDKNSINAASSVHVRFIYDEMTFKFTYRCDGQPTWNAALTPKNGTNTLSPFIGLATRA